MKNSKFNIYQIVAVIVMIIGIFFSYLVAELDDAPGVIIIGSAIVVGSSLILYGIGEITKYLKKNNELLADIYKIQKEKSK